MTKEIKMLLTLKSLEHKYKCDLKYNDLVDFNDWSYYFNKVIELTRKYSINIDRFSFENRIIEMKLDNGFYIDLSKIADDFIVFTLSSEYLEMDFIVDSCEFVDFFDNFLFIVKNYLVNPYTIVILKKDILTPFYKIEKGTKLHCNKLCEDFNIDFEYFMYEFANYLECFEIQR